MDSIVKIIETRIEKSTAHTSFTYLEDGETSETVISLSGIREIATRLSSDLQRRNPVLIILPQGLSFIGALFGCLYSGAIAVPIPIPAKTRGSAHLQNIIADTRSQQIITDKKTHEKLINWFDAGIFKTISWLFIEDFENGRVGETVVEFPKAEHPAFLQYTSGSTGKPKAVVITHENILANSAFIKERSGNTNSSSAVSWLPCFHDMGLIEGIFQPVFANFPSVIMSPVHFIQKPVRWFSAMTKYRATTSGAPNFGFEYCVERIKDDELKDIDLTSLRCLYNGAEPIRPQTLRNFVERFSSVGFSKEKIVSCYGLAEATLAVTISEVGKSPELVKVSEKALSENRFELAEGYVYIELVGSGKPSGNTLLKIVNEKTLEERAPSEIGEILVAGKTVAAGYFAREKETDKTFITIAGQRYLRTGDLGFIREGELYVTGRIKDLIIIRGKNHYPQDIEQTVSTSHKSLGSNACAAFSISEGSEEKLVIVQEIKRNSLQNTDFDAVLTQIIKAVSKDHGIQPHQIVLIRPGRLPKTTSGKIRRIACRTMWQSNSLDPLAKHSGFMR